MSGTINSMLRWVGLADPQPDPNALYRRIAANPVGTEQVPTVATTADPSYQPPPSSPGIYGWLRDQQQISADRGLWTGGQVWEGGRPTGAGVVDAAQQTGNALLMGTTAPGIRAYHGSPHSFDKFSSDYIGTTTGEAAFSRGHNFADEKTAKVYRDTLAPTGHMYEVNIRAPEEHFLDWDKPLSEQSPYVQKALNDAGITKGTLDADPTGADLHTMLRSGIGMVDKEGGLFYPGGKAKRTDVQTVQMLRDAGIPGMRHHGDSYVVYDDSIIDILRKYGIAGLIAGGGAAAGTQGQQ